MTPRGRALAATLQGVFAELAELERTAPADVDVLVGTLVAHLRAWKPVSVAPLGTLPPPGEPIRDPRGCP